MSISSVSFWQQDQNYWSRSSQRTQSLASSAALMSVMSDAMTSLSQGLASIANQTALDRTNAALSAALQSALQGSTGTSTGSSTGASSTSGSSSASGSTSGSASPGDNGAISGPAIGTGTVPLTSSTSLQTFHIIKGGTFSVSDGIGTTVYTSNGSDTVGDLINAINSASPGHAQAFAWVDAKGKLNVAATDTSHTITIGGTAAAALGFGTGNTYFQPATNSASGTTTAAASSTSATGSNSSQSGSGATTASRTNSLFAQNSSTNLLTGGTAETLLASNGSAGFLVNLLA
jgi:hypothetical protein